MREHIKTPEKRTKQNGDKQSLRVQITKELSEDLNSIKKMQSEMKDTLIEIKNNLQGNNSRVDRAENQVNGFEHKQKKQPIRTIRTKKNPNK